MQVKDREMARNQKGTAIHEDTDGTHNHERVNREPNILEDDTESNN